MRKKASNLDIYANQSPNFGILGLQTLDLDFGLDNSPSLHFLAVNQTNLTQLIETLMMNICRSSTRTMTGTLVITIVKCLRNISSSADLV